MKCRWLDSLRYLQRRMHIVSALALSFGVSFPVLSQAQTAQSYRQQATELARAKSWDDAIAAYRKALVLEPDDCLTHYDLALALNYKGETKQAVEEFETAIRLKPRWGQAHYALGASLYDLHDQAGALKELRKRWNASPPMLPHIVCSRVFIRSRMIFPPRNANSTVR